MALLDDIVNSLDTYFDVQALSQDPGFSKSVPKAYGRLGLDWQAWFEHDFSQRFNGLMLRGTGEVHTVFLAVFPSTEIFQHLMSQASPGDLLFVHHPLDFRCGDPRGAWGEGDAPLTQEQLQALKTAGLSLYALHAPLDYHRTISTSRSLVKLLNGTVVDEFMPYGNGNAGVIARLSPTSTQELCERMQSALGLPYLDVAGPSLSRIELVAAVGGCGDDLAFMREMEARGIQAYVTGEIRTRIEGLYGREKYRRISEFAQSSSMSLIGVSHAASEFAVMHTDMAQWFASRFHVQTTLLPETVWWR